MAAKFKTYQALLRMLKKDCPVAFPVSVRRVKLSKLEGRCWKQGKKFFIQLDSTLCESRSMDVLIHEWAHARAWNHMLDSAVDDAAFNKLAHDAAWGVAYAEIYATYERIFTNVAVL
ncbi:hypothetical protein [Sphingorhabdus sp.]|uniref:hypothetical protein n=1 Tax=Sphingorhabdus sp. TaxID=1902408 RepID=UPI00333F9C48